MKTDNDKWVEERLEVCRYASSQLKKLKKQLRKVVIEFTTLHDNVKSDKY